MEYALLDSGSGRKLERFGPHVLARPSLQAVWHPSLPDEQWKKADGTFSRDPENRWTYKRSLPDAWTVRVADINFKIAPTDFGHLGIFPEQADFWAWMQQVIREAKKKGRDKVEVLNLFAYSGGSTLSAAAAGAHVCHLDASKGMVDWARENAALNKLESAPIRWIVDDVQKFLQRELRRERRYDAIILDPPSFGRGNRGEIFKIEDDLPKILDACRQLLSDSPLFVLFSCHTPGFTPIAMQHLMVQMMHGLKGEIDAGEMVLKGASGVFPVPSGCFSRWQKGTS